MGEGGISKGKGRILVIYYYHRIDLVIKLDNSSYKGLWHTSRWKDSLGKERLR